MIFQHLVYHAVPDISDTIDEKNIYDICMGIDTELYYSFLITNIFIPLLVSKTRAPPEKTDRGGS